MNNTTYYSVLAVASILTYYYITDPPKLVLAWTRIKFIPLRLKQLQWVILSHPRSPIANWLWNRKMKKVTIELIKEHEQKQTDNP